MYRAKESLVILTFSVLFAEYVQTACAHDQNEMEAMNVTIELLRLDVNETTMELSYKIKNNNDYDIWICDSVDLLPDETQQIFEVFYNEDEQALVIRKRLDVPPPPIERFVPFIGRYVRLRGGQEHTESLSLSVPVEFFYVYYSGKYPDAKHAHRLILEIGFYNEDLPETIRAIGEMAEILSCRPIGPGQYSSALIKRFFRGFYIESSFGGLARFTESDQMTIPYSDQTFISEQVLHLKIDGILIPIGGYSVTENLVELTDSSGSPNSGVPLGTDTFGSAIGDRHFYGDCR